MKRVTLADLKKKIRKKPNTKRKPVIGVAVFNGPIVYGEVVFREGTKEPNKVFMISRVSGLRPNSYHAIHIHEAGDLRGEGCQATCSHFNPSGSVHGGPRSREHHMGDLGNLRTNRFGESQTRQVVDFLRLRGEKNIIGRSVVIHKNIDDLGEGLTEESLKTGSAGSRIGCAVIGYSQKSQLYF